MAKDDRTMGDNSEKFGVDKLPPDMPRATFLAAVRKMDEFEEQRTNLNKAVGRFRKDLQSHGIILGVFDEVRGMRDLERPEIKAKMQQRFEYMRFLELPVGKQADLFPKDAGPQTEDAAYIDGYQKGVMGKGTGSPPEQFSSGKQQQSWLAGWNKGQEQLAFNMFDKKDYFKETVKDSETTSRGPAGGDEDEEDDDDSEHQQEPAAANVTSLADAKAKKAEAEKPAEKPAKAAVAPKSTDPTEVAKRVAAKGKKKPAAEKNSAAESPAPTPKKTKAELVAEGGGVGGLAPAGARKGGGDFDDEGNDIPQAKVAAAEDDLDVDDDLEIDDDDLDLEDA